jgi:hypothetical protein
VVIALVVMLSQKESKYVFLKNNPEIANEIQKDCVERAFKERDSDILLEKDCFYASNAYRYDKEEIEKARKEEIEKIQNLKSTSEEDNTTSESSEEVPIIGRGLQFKCTDFHRSRGTC